jgi:hypothetical protein
MNPARMFLESLDRRPGIREQPGSKAALTAPKSNFRFTPDSGLNSDTAPCPFRANNGLMHRSKMEPYSITPSARSRNDSGTVSPSALAPSARFRRFYRYLGPRLSDRGADDIVDGLDVRQLLKRRTEPDQSAPGVWREETV